MKINITDKVVFSNVENLTLCNKSTNSTYDIINGQLEIDFDELSDGKNIFPMEFDFYIEKCIVKNEPCIYAYKTKYNNLVIYKGESVRGNSNLVIENFSYKKEQIKLDVRTYVINDTEDVDNLVLIERKTKVEHNFKVTPNTKQILISPSEMDIDGIYDIFANINVAGVTNYRKRIGKYRYRKEILLRDKTITEGENQYIISPYTTYKAKFLTIKLTKIEKRKNNLFTDSLVRTKKYWIVGEQPLKAQDNGYYFFKYCRENHPEMPIYYVLDKNSMDHDKVKALGNLIEFGSDEHYKKIARAKYLITTHHDEYLFPYQSKELIKKITAKRVFLQHGVMGTKYMANFYGKYCKNFRADMFVVSSDREKEMMISDFGYKEQDIRVTGLPRFDNLFVDCEIDKEISVIPTWRDWLTATTDFTATMYFEKYSSLVKSLVEKGYDVTFVLHINMAHYKEEFENMGIKVYTPNDIDVQNVLKTSKLLITDYSSVSFDFAFLEKPVIYYQFDQNRFFGRNGSHFDIYSELPGDIATSEEGVLNKLEELKEKDYKINATTITKINNLCKYQDTNNSKRLYEEILKGANPSKTPFYKQTSYLKLFSYYRRSRAYYPTMKFMYNVLSRLPKKDVVLIETTNGSSITDSPKEIYLKWSEIDKNQRFVFAYNYVLPHKYKHNTIAVKRLSPSYFYYMATSKVWINNQNFPFYFTNRNTFYLQTWHGTPIKKMLHDIEVVHGRDSGYVGRVTTAISNWSYVLSPSSYATECFKTAFEHDCKAIELGYPRNDFLHDSEKMTQLSSDIKGKYGIDKNKKVILFAPTFRDDAKKRKGKFVLDLNFDFERFYEQFGDEYVVLFKLHFLSVFGERLPSEYNKTFINVTSHSDINELFSVADILVTDYSSVMFDFINTGRKTILYAHDLENYELNNRGFYLDYKSEAPGAVVETFDELLNEIQDENLNYDIDKCRERFISEFDGNSAQKVVEFIKKEVKWKNMSN